jgi:glycosyltransferase involved in cell wall biosynthesis
MQPPQLINSATFSIVTCSYQQGRYLDATLRSVLDQGMPGLEYIVIDGGSNDGSVEVIRAHERDLAYWVSEPDRGQTDALIKGFSRATGEICGWLCSDDLLLPGALARVAGFFAANPGIDAVYGDALWIDAQGNYIRPKREMPFSRFVMLFDHNYIAQPSMFWRRSLYERVRGLDADFNLAMDADLWERFSRHTRIAHLDAYLSCMRYYPEQKTRAMKPQGRAEDARIRARSSLAAWPWAAPLLRGAARAGRIAGKALSGGYWGTPGEDCLRALERYRITPQGAHA